MARRLIPLLVLLALAPVTARAETVVVVADGQFFYDSTDDGICNPDTNDHTEGIAVRHWHVGFPFVGPGLGSPDPELLGGTAGCLGNPKTYVVNVPAGGGVLAGTVRYAWDQDVPGGGFNDVHLHVFDADGDRVASTFDTDGPEPVVPGVTSLVLEREASFELAPGTYRVVEDIFSGEHTTWLTNLTLTT